MAADAIHRVEGVLDMPLDAPKYLNNIRIDDFSCGRTVVIDGWVLARCEADLCAALAAVTNA